MKLSSWSPANRDCYPLKKYCCGTFWRPPKDSFETFFVWFRAWGPWRLLCHALQNGYRPTYRKAFKINKLKTIPTPNKNGSYGIEGGFVCHILGPVCHIFCRNPLILTDFMPYGPPLYGIFLGHIFCKYGGWGWSELFS